MPSDGSVEKFGVASADMEGFSKRHGLIDSRFGTELVGEFD
jgi:hypothetical protein